MRPAPTPSPLAHAIDGALLRHWREVFGLALLGLALLGLFGRTVLSGAIAHQRDTGAFYYPLTTWYAQELQSGRFPLWCPLIFGGYPLFADGEIGMLHPLNVLALLTLPPDLAFVLARTGQYFIAGLGAYWLGRVLGLGRIAAAYGGVTFALGAFMVGHLDHANILRSAALLPALFASGDMALRSGGARAARWTAAGAAVLALIGYGLHPQILLIILVGLWCYLPARWLALSLQGSLRPRKEGSGVRAPLRALLWMYDIPRLALVLGAMTGLGLAGAAVQLVPTYELGTYSSRGEGVVYVNASAGALSPYDLGTLILPYLFRADPRNVWTLFPYWEVSLYVGVVGLVLAALGLVLGRARTTLPLVFLGLVGLALGMAAYFPIDVYSWLWHLPGFSSMRMPGRYGLLIELALALLAAVGLDRLRVVAGTWRARACVVLVGAAGLGVVYGLVSLRDWLLVDQERAIAAIQATFLTATRDRPNLNADHVYRGVLASLDPANAWTMLSLYMLLAALGLLLVWLCWPRGGRIWQVGLVAFAAYELLLVAHSFHPLTTIESLDEASRPWRFLSATSGGHWRSFISGWADSAITSRPALFGVAQSYGYSSLPTSRMERYWTRVNEVDDEMLDIWNTRYVIEQRPVVGRIQAHDVLFNPARPLVDGPSNNPLGQETFSLPPTTADTVRLLSMVSEASLLTDGTAVAEIIVSGGNAPPERLVARLGVQTSEAAYEDSTAGQRAHHRKAEVGYFWEPRDPSGRSYPRNIYVADMRLSSLRQVERIEVRTVLPIGQFRLAGLALRDGTSGAIASVLPTHREKYVRIYEDERTAIYENRAVLPRAFVSHRAVLAETDDWSYLLMLKPGFDPRQQVLLERADPYGAGGGGADSDPPTVRADPAAAPELTMTAATIEVYEPDRVVVRASSVGGGHLVLTDTYYPGWRAWVDGREAQIERANYLFRAVVLEPGEHVVEFRFQPPSIFVGALVSGVAWLVILGLAIAPGRRRR